MKSGDARDEENVLGAFSLLFCSRKFTLNETLTTWPKFLLFNPGACHTHIKWFFTASWWEKSSAGVASDRFRVVLINAFFLVSHLYRPRPLAFCNLTFRCCKITPKACLVYWLANQYQKAIPTLPDHSLAVNLSTIGQWHKVNICKDSRIMPPPLTLAMRREKHDDRERYIEGKESDFDKDMTFHSLVGLNHWWLMDLITSA